MGHGPFKEFQSPIKVLDERAATLDPIAIVAVQDAVDVPHLGAVNMTTNHPVVTPFSRFIGHSDLKVCDEIQGLFHFVLQVTRKRPIRQPQTSAQVVQMAVQLECEFVQVVADKCYMPLEKVPYN